MAIQVFIRRSEPTKGSALWLVWLGTGIYNKVFIFVFSPGFGTMDVAIRQLPLSTRIALIHWTIQTTLYQDSELFTA